MIDRKKYLTVLIIITCVFCASCGKKRVEYYAPSDEKASASDAPNDEVGTFNESIKVNGYTVSVDAKTELPKSKPNVYTAKEVDWTEEEKQELINIISEGSDGKLYSGKEEDIPKCLRYYELKGNEMNYNFAVANENEESYRAQYDYLLQKYNDAPDAPIEATDLSQENYYIKKQDLYYRVSFTQGFSFLVVKQDYFPARDNGESYGSISSREDASYYISDAEKDIDSYIEASQKYLDKFNFGEFKPMIINELTFVGYYYDDKKSEILSDDIAQGYEIIFTRSLYGYPVDWRYYNDKKFSTVDEENDFHTQMGAYSPMHLFEKINICVDSDLNILGLWYTCPLEDIEIKKDEVNIIDFDKAKQLILDELVKNPKYDMEKVSVLNGVYHYIDSNMIKSWDDFSLEYMRIKGENKGEYLLVPAWCLNRKDYMKYKSGVVINALDGSVIYPVDEIYY